MYCRNDDTPLEALKDSKSWNTRFRAAQVREHTPLLNLAETLNAEEVPNISYHCKCRQLFTMKRDIDQINKTNHNSDSIDENNEHQKDYVQDQHFFQN